MTIRRSIIKISILLACLSLVLAGLIMIQGGGGRYSFSSDMKVWVRLFMFRNGLIPELKPSDTYALFNSTCNRGCHSMNVIYEAIHTPLGWAQVIERMVTDNNVSINSREKGVLIRYLQDNFPARRSSLPMETIKKVKKLVWRNDIGYGDVYVDIFYATKEYFMVIESLSEAEKYSVDTNMVFIVDLTVHQGRLPSFPLDEKMVLRDDRGNEYSPLPGWTMRMESRDGHHREGVVSFAKKDRSGNPVIRKDAKYIEVVIKDLGGHRERIYRWDLPLNYPSDIISG